MKRNILKTISARWRTILSVLLVFSILTGIFGVVFFVGKRSNKEDPTISGHPSKVGLYRDAEGTLNYTYLDNIRQIYNKDKLGFSLTGGLGFGPDLVDAWVKVNYDRERDPYLEVGKQKVKTESSVIFSPVSENGNTVVFETDFCWLGSENGIGEDLTTDSDPTWHTELDVMKKASVDKIAYLRFYMSENGKFMIDRNNKQSILGYYDLGEWYNLRIEISPSKTDHSVFDYKIYIDNVLVDNYSGLPYNCEWTIDDEVSVMIQQRYKSNDVKMYLDNTYFSKR